MSNKIEIPDTFKLYPHDYKIKKEKGMCVRDGLLGQHRANERVIRLQIKEKGMDHPESEYLQTYYHEKVHAILDIMGESDLNNKESFVDLFATFLLQSDLTSKFGGFIN